MSVHVGTEKGKAATSTEASETPAPPGEEVNPFKGAEKAEPWSKRVALATLLGGLLYCLYFAGDRGWSHAVPFQAHANFALFAAFIVIAGAIERFIDPSLVVLPPYEKRAVTGTDGPSTKASNEVAQADRTLLAFSIALLVGIAISSLFGFYFLETMGVKVGVKSGAGWTFHGDGEKFLRGLDIYVTALIITGGTKPLHDLITSIEKKKEALTQAVSGS
jgi:hypothetical protein